MGTLAPSWKPSFSEPSSSESSSDMGASPANMHVSGGGTMMMPSSLQPAACLSVGGSSVLDGPSSQMLRTSAIGRAGGVSLCAGGVVSWLCAAGMDVDLGTGVAALLMLDCWLGMVCGVMVSRCARVAVVAGTCGTGAAAGPAALWPAAFSSSVPFAV